MRPDLVALFLVGLVGPRVELDEVFQVAKRGRVVVEVIGEQASVAQF